MALTRSLSRLATILTDPGAGQRLALVGGTITAVDVAGALDGSDVATVTIGADDLEAPRLASYSPTVDDVVAVLLVDSSPLILGRVTGAPDIS